MQSATKKRKSVAASKREAAKRKPPLMEAGLLPTEAETLTPASPKKPTTRTPKKTAKQKAAKSSIKRKRTARTR